MPPLHFLHVFVCLTELEERARLLKQRLNIKSSAAAALAAADAGAGGVPYSDSELSGSHHHRSRPGRDPGRKTTAARSEDSASQRGAGAARWNSSGDRGAVATGATGRHTGRSSAHRHDYQRRSHTADSDRIYRRRGKLNHFMGATENARLENEAQKRYWLICVVLYCVQKKSNPLNTGQ